MRKRCKVVLTNHEGRKHTFILRGYKLGDEAGIRVCIQDEYEDTYFKKGLYRKDYIWNEVLKRNITPAVVEDENGHIAGFLLLKQFYPDESMCEIGSQIILKKYRGYGLAALLFQYGMEVLLSRQYTAALCHPVMYHDISQRLLNQLGLRATGLLMNTVDVEKEKHSYQNGRNKKTTFGIQVMALSKWNAGNLYLPKEHVDFCRKIYDSLGVSYLIVETEQHHASVFQKSGKVKFKYNVDQEEIQIYIKRPEEDVKAKIDLLLRQMPLEEKRTATVFINCNHPGAVGIYEWLRERGFFFTGLKPLCSEYEYLVMHHAGEVEVYFEDFIVSDEFQGVLNYVEKSYRRKYELVE